MIEADELISFDSNDIELVSIKDTLLSLSTNLLDGIDIIALDIQDIGSRFNSKLHYVTSLIEIAGMGGVEFMILDRPNPISGVIIEGPIPSVNMKSSEKIFPIPTRHGLTIGEIAHLAYVKKWFSIPLPLPLLKWINGVGTCSMMILGLVGYHWKKIYLILKLQSFTQVCVFTSLQMSV